MLFFDDKLLLKCSGVTGGFLACNRFKTADARAADVFSKAAAARDAAYANAHAHAAVRNAAHAAVRDAANADARDAAARAFDAFAAACDAYDAAYDAYAAACAAYDDAYDAACAANADARLAQNRAILFKPFESKSDAALSLLSIISAPMFLTFLALDEMVSFIVSGLKFIANLVTSGPDAAKESGAEAVNHLLGAFTSLLAAVVSPVINAVDFVGSCVTTSTEIVESPSVLRP